MKQSRNLIALAGLFFLLTSCSDMMSEENEITKCQAHCSEKGMVMDYDQTQLRGRCFCEIEKNDY